jgi:phage major head subunit gpT-like protein
MEITTASLLAAKRGLTKVFDKAYYGITDPWWKKIAMSAASDGEAEEYHWLGDIGGLKELLGEISIENLLRHAYTIKNREWHNTKGIKRTSIERDKLSVYHPMLGVLAENAANHPGNLVAELLVNGFTKLDYTGSAFFATGKKAHAKAKAFSNKGTKKLSEANYQLARANLTGRLTPDGTEAMRLGKDLQLIVSPTWEAEAKKIVTAETINNNTNINRGTATVMSLPELLALGAEDSWFLVEAGSAMKAFIVQIEKQPSTAMDTDPNSAQVIKSGEFLFQVYARHNAGYGLPELAYGSTGADAD